MRHLRYLINYWRHFVVAISSGVGISIIIVPSVLESRSLQSLLIVQNWLPLYGFLLVVLGVLLLSTVRSVNFWRRYRITHQLNNPPILQVDLIGVGLLAAGITVYVLIQINANLPNISESIRTFLIVLGLLIGIWLIASILGSYWEQNSENSFLPRKGGSEDYSDDPISEDKEDILGRLPFVDGLYRQIVYLPFQDSFVFGLYGSWGEGKTSVLNLLRHRLRKHSEVITVNFNPWYLATEAALTGC